MVTHQVSVLSPILLAAVETLSLKWPDRVKCCMLMT